MSPLDYLGENEPCDECNARPGEPCGPGCTALVSVLNGIEDAWQSRPAPHDADWLNIAVERLRYEADVARLAPNGRHPKIALGTHAAALGYAADMLARWRDAL